MTDPRDELREKVVTALRAVYSENEWGTPDALVAWDDLMQQEKQHWYKEADAAIAVALEEAAKLCDYYAERHIDPMNFAKECAADIRALIPSASASDS